MPEHMQGDLAELKLSDTWNNNPVCWKNYVAHIIDHYGLKYAGHHTVMDQIHQDLLTWDLELDHGRKCLTGHPNNLTAWMLTYA